MIDIAYTLELPMGHRLQKHRGACRFAHGHNYLISVTLRGQPDPNSGMVIDFADLKKACRDYFLGWDHAFCVESGDPLAAALEPLAKVITIPHPPTAEILAMTWALGLQSFLTNQPEVHIRVCETRDCFVSYTEYARHA